MYVSTDKLMHFVVGIAVGVRFWQLLERYAKVGARRINPIWFLIMLIWGASGLFFFRKLHIPVLSNDFAVLKGSLAVKVDAHYTSQACPCCGHTSKENRPNKGLSLVCQQCAYTLHADLIGARNVALRVLLSRQEWESTGRLSAVPDVSGDETETVYRLRYSGLRWSQDAIPNFNAAPPQGEAE